MAQGVGDDSAIVAFGALAGLFGLLALYHRPIAMAPMFERQSDVAAIADASMLSIGLSAEHAHGLGIPASNPMQVIVVAPGSYIEPSRARRRVVVVQIRDDRTRPLRPGILRMLVYSLGQQGKKNCYGNHSITSSHRYTIAPRKEKAGRRGERHRPGFYFVPFRFCSSRNRFTHSNQSGSLGGMSRRTSRATHCGIRSRGNLFPT